MIAKLFYLHSYTTLERIKGSSVQGLISQLDMVAESGHKSENSNC